MTSGTHNTAIGTCLLYTLIQQDLHNTAIGNQALGSGSTTGSNNIAFGQNAGKFFIWISSSNNQVAIGYWLWSFLKH
jgi:hypothetical protein